MATKAKESRKRSMWVVFALIAAAALCLLAMAAGWISSPLLDSWFGGNGSSQSGGNGGDGDGSGAGGGSCFLGIVCLNAGADGGGVDAQATVQP
jgi:hypothetical protein